MKAVKILLLSIIIIILGIIVLTYSVWLAYPTKKIELYILDKTVKDFSYNEHRSLFWLLNNSKFVKGNGKQYNYKKDYFGFLPIPPFSDREYELKRIGLEQIDSISNSYDGLYYADTYGVYFNEWFRGFRQGAGDNSLIEGGLNQNDYLLLKSMKKQHKLIVCEYNTLELPTAELIKFRTAEQLGIQITGWCGKYFSSLDSTHEYVPKTIISNYMNANNNQWPFKKSGIILVKNTGEEIVLESGTHLNAEKPFIFVNENNCKKYQTTDHVDYTNWFEIVSANDTMEVIAKYQLNVNASGESLLNSNNLKSSFPSVVACHNYNLNIYYFAGNFASNNVPIIYARLANSRKIIRKISFNDNSVFFFDFYFPLMENILNEYIFHEKKQ